MNKTLGRKSRKIGGGNTQGKRKSKSNSRSRSSTSSQMSNKKYDTILLNLFLKKLGYHEEGLVDTIKNSNQYIKKKKSNKEYKFEINNKRYIDIRTIYQWPGETTDTELIINHAVLMLEDIKSGTKFADIKDILGEMNTSLKHSSRDNYADIYIEKFGEAFSEIEHHIKSKKTKTKTKTKTKELFKRENRWMLNVLRLLNLGIKDIAKPDFFKQFEIKIEEFMNELYSMAGVPIYTEYTN